MQQEFHEPAKRATDDLSATVNHLMIRPLKRAHNLFEYLVQGWRATRLPLAILFHAFSVMNPPANAGGTDLITPL